MLLLLDCLIFSRYDPELPVPHHGGLVLAPSRGLRGFLGSSKFDIITRVNGDDRT